MKRQKHTIDHLATMFLLPFLVSAIYYDVADAYECMDAVFGKTTNCNANDVKFDSIAGIQVNDPPSATSPCNCNCGGDTGVTCSGWSETEAAVDCDSITTPISCWAPDDGTLQPIGVIFGACLGSDDNVTVTISVDLTVTTTRYDVAMYINLNGGSARTGTECAILPMVDGTYGQVTVATTGSGTDNDGCPDFTSTGTLTNFEFAPITLQCSDLYSSSSSTDESDGLLDFDIAISWDQNHKTECNFDGNVANLPKPGTPSKCWIPDDERKTLPIYVPPPSTPSTQPSVGSVSASSIQPSISSIPSTSITSAPSSSNLPSVSSEPSNKPSQVPSKSAAPSEDPSNKATVVPSMTLSIEPSSKASAKPSTSIQPTSDPSLTPSESVQPSLQPSDAPSTSAKPSSGPSIGPSVSFNPTSDPSLAPSESVQPSLQPSFEPSVSVSPSFSFEPSLSTEEPSSSPNTSSHPSQSPSLNPSLSSMPSSDPSAKPSDQVSICLN